MALKLVFMGTPDFSAPALDAILSAGHHVVAVYSQPPRPQGRGLAEKKQPVHAFAASKGLEVRTPLSLKGEAEQQAFAALGADAAVVIAYGLILPRAVLAAPRLGCFNVHASRLPRWRGAAPIQRAIMAGDAETAVMVMKMDQGLDTGPIGLADDVAIGPDMTAGELHDELSRRGAALIAEALARIDAGSLSFTAQPAEGVTYAAKISKSEARIDFTRPAREIHNLIRGLSPFPGAWFEAAPEGGAKERIKVIRSSLATGSGASGTALDYALTIACGEGAIRLVEVQRAGKKAMSAGEFLRGFPVPKGRALAVNQA